MSLKKIVPLLIGIACVGIASFVLYEGIQTNYEFSFNRRTLKIVVFYLLGIFQLYKAFAKDEEESE